MDTYKDLLRNVVQYAINPDMRITRKEIFDFIVTRVLMKGGKNDFEHIKSAIESNYKITLPESTLQQTIEELEKDGIVKHSMFSNDNKEVIYEANSTSDKVQKYYDLEKKYEAKIQQIKKYLFSKLQDYGYSSPTDSEKEEIMLDFFTLLRVIASIYSQDLLATAGKKDYFKWSKKISYPRQDVEPNLKNAMRKIFEDIQTEKIGPIIREFLNIAIFWNMFTAILPYQKDVRNFLREKKEELLLFLDTNVLISAVCHHDAFHFVTLAQIKYLREAGIKICYTDQTAKELETVLSGVKNAVLILESYPYAIARAIARNTRNAVLIGYFEERYQKWKKYYDEFQESLKKLSLDVSIMKQTPLFAQEFDIDLRKLQNPDEVMVSYMTRKLHKHEEAAKHDALLLSLIREIRRTYQHRGGEWFVHWILTLDTGLRDRDREITTEKGKNEWPACIHIPQVRLLFEPYTLAAAVREDLNLDNWKIYNSLLEVSQIPAETIGVDIVEATKNLSSIEVSDLLVQYLRRMCWEEYQ
jgi:DNA-binding HxlR family transcriptional regulator